MKRILALLLSLLLITTVSGCGAQKSTPRSSLDNSSAVSDKNPFQSGDETSGGVLGSNPNSDKATWMMKNKSTGKTGKLVRNPMQALSKEPATIYGCGDFVYYIQTDADASGFFSIINSFSVVEVDTRNFSEKTIFERNLNVNRDTFLSIGKPQEQDVKFFSLVNAFFLDDQNLYFVGKGQVCKVNRTTGKRDIIIETPSLKSLSFDGTSIYYSNAESKLMKYDVRTGRETELYGTVTESFLLTDKQKVIFINRLDRDKLYALSLKDGSQRKILDQPLLSFRLDGENVVYVSKTDSSEHQIKPEY